MAEGTNLIVATAQNNVGDSASDSITVRRDTEPPLVVIETPQDGDRLVCEVVTIAGTVNDIIPGATVNEDDVTVTVNGFPATVNNRTFILPDLPLTSGSNTVTATAVDRAGNTSDTSITVSREQDLAGIQIVIAGGNNQRGSVNSLLPEPLTVRMVTTEGEPIASHPFGFEVSRGDGSIGDPNIRQTTVLTDAEGGAAVNITLSSRTGEGFHRVRVTTPESLTFAEFCATAEPAAATTTSIAGIPLRRGVAGQVPSEPLSVIVTDVWGNPVPNLPVAFQVDLGGGNFGGQQSTTVNTNPVVSQALN